LLWRLVCTYTSSLLAQYDELAAVLSMESEICVH